MQKDTLPFNENLIFKITMGRKQKQNKIQYCINTALSFVYLLKKKFDDGN